MLMEFLQPESLAEALAAKAAAPEAVPIAGGTDVMVELNFARRRPSTRPQSPRPRRADTGGNRRPATPSPGCHRLCPGS